MPPNDKDKKQQPGANPTQPTTPSPDPKQNPPSTGNQNYDELLKFLDEYYKLVQENKFDEARKKAEEIGKVWPEKIKDIQDPKLKELMEKAGPLFQIPFVGAQAQIQTKFGRMNQDIIDTIKGYNDYLMAISGGNYAQQLKYVDDLNKNLHRWNVYVKTGIDYLNPNEKDFSPEAWFVSQKGLGGTGLNKVGIMPTYTLKPPPVQQPPEFRAFPQIIPEGIEKLGTQTPPNTPSSPPPRSGGYYGRSQQDEDKGVGALSDSGLKPFFGDNGEAFTHNIGDVTNLITANNFKERLPGYNVFGDVPYNKMKDYFVKNKHGAYNLGELQKAINNAFGRSDVAKVSIGKNASGDTVLLFDIDLDKSGYKEWSPQTREVIRKSLGEALLNFNRGKYAFDIGYSALLAMKQGHGFPKNEILENGAKHDIKVIEKRFQSTSLGKQYKSFWDFVEKFGGAYNAYERIVNKRELDNKFADIQVVKDLMSNIRMYALTFTVPYILMNGGNIIYNGQRHSWLSQEDKNWGIKGRK